MRTFGFILQLEVLDGDVGALQKALDAQQAELDARLDRAGGLCLLTAYVRGDDLAQSFSQLLRTLGGFRRPPTVLRMHDDLVSASDIAARLGVSRQAVHKMISEEGSEFPTPWSVVASTRVWRWAEVNEWLRARRPDRADQEYWPLADDAVRLNCAVVEARTGLASVPEARGTG